jgi:hypothetical protein
MTSPNRRLSLDEVLDEFFYPATTPSPAVVLRACEAHPEYREDILEFAALWSAHEASPEVSSATVVEDVSDELVSRLQSFVLNRLHELDVSPVSESDKLAAQTAVRALAGGRLKRAALATGLGESTVLLTKVLTNRIRVVPTKVLEDLASHLHVASNALQQCLGFQLVGNMRYSASERPDAPTMETWDSAVMALSVSDSEKRRLLALKGGGETS